MAKDMDDTYKKKDTAFDELAMESGAFEDLERDFQEVLAELVGEKSLEKFRVEYEKLHRALKKSHESEKRLIKRCKELNTEIVSNAAKVQTALKLSQEDTKTINSLKKEIEKAWKMVDASHEKEAHANTTINKLRDEIGNLSRLVEQGTGLSTGQEHSVKELLKMKEDLTKETEALKMKIISQREEIDQYREKLQQLEGKKLDVENELVKQKDFLSTKEEEVEKERRRKDMLEKDLREMRTVVEQRQEEIKKKSQQIQVGHERLQRLELALKDQKSLTEQAVKDYDQLNARTQKLQQDLEEQMQANTQLLTENAKRQVELKEKEAEIAALQVKEENSAKIKEQLLKKVKQLELQEKEVEVQKEALRVEIRNLETEIENNKKLAEADKKAMEDLMRERDILNKNLVKASNSQQKQADLVKISESTKKNYEQEIQGYKIQAQKQRKTIYELEKQREQYINQANEATTKYLQAMEEVKLREMNIFELQKKIAEAEGKLKQQQNLYEAVRSDRNMYSKNLIESQDEVLEMKRKFRIMNQQIEQLKEEIATKDRSLVKEHFDHMKVIKEKDSYKNELSRFQAQIDLAEQTIGSQQAEVQKLNHIINEAELERMAQKKEFDRIKNERDMLGAQMVRKNDELALLYEKTKVQQSTLQKGEAQYHERLEDMRILKIKIKELKRELSVTKSKVSRVDVLKNEVYTLERQLLQERTKVKALSEELENPMNIHRWRKLEGSDPVSYEMIQKVQTLQKRLIAKTEEVVDKDIKIQALEKKIEELNVQLKRMPSEEHAAKLAVYKSNLKEKTKQMKALTAQLNMYEVQVENYKHEMAVLTGDVQELQKKYYESKKRESARASLNASDELPATPNSNANSGRFVGGGFRAFNATSQSQRSPVSTPPIQPQLNVLQYTA